MPREQIFATARERMNKFLQDQNLETLECRKKYDRKKTKACHITFACASLIKQDLQGKQLISVRTSLVLMISRSASTT